MKEIVKYQIFNKEEFSEEYAAEKREKEITDIFCQYFDKKLLSSGIDVSRKSMIQIVEMFVGNIEKVEDLYNFFNDTINK